MGMAPVTSDTRDPVIEVADLSYAYPGGVRALDGIRFTVAAGESVGLVGPNGAGKTTLVRTLLGELRPDEGEVRVGLNTKMR